MFAHLRCANLLLMAGAAGLRMHHRLHSLLIGWVALHGMTGELAMSMYSIWRLDRNVYDCVWAYSVFPGALRIAAPVFARIVFKICLRNKNVGDARERIPLAGSAQVLM